ncbi:hypothetical protein ACWCQZ_41020 [Streptomyces sp. NPDC002285]
MEVTASSRKATTGSSVVLVAGFVLVAYSIFFQHGDVAGPIGGACLVVCALAFLAFNRVKELLCDTAEERRILAAATQAAQNEMTRFYALEAALEGEHARLSRDMAAERARMEAQLVAERRKMRRDFEEERATLAAESFRTGVDMERAGILKGKAPQPGTLIQFPRDLPQQQPERAREHGVVGP